MMIQVPQKIKCTDVKVDDNYIMPTGNYVIIDPMPIEDGITVKNGVAIPNKEKPRYNRAKVLAVPLNCNRINPSDLGSTIVYETAMVEVVSIGETEVIFLSETYIIAVLRDEDCEMAMVPVDSDMLRQMQQQQENDLDPFGTSDRPRILVPSLQMGSGK